jgi:hypothetical protein
MSPMWDDKPEPASGMCTVCGRETDDGVVVWVTRSSAADVRLVVHADPAACTPAAPTGGGHHA